MHCLVDCHARQQRVNSQRRLGRIAVKQVQLRNILRSEKLFAAKSWKTNISTKSQLSDLQSVKWKLNLDSECAPYTTDAM